MTADVLRMWQPGQQQPRPQQSPVKFAAAARRAAAASAAEMAFDHAQEGGSGVATASKVTTALVEAAAPLHAARAVGVQQMVLSPVAAGAATDRSDVAQQAGSQGPASQPTMQLPEFNAAAMQASRTAAKQSSMSVLVSLPYLEVLCYGDLGCAGGAVGTRGPGHQ
jgi:hypothetical protein